MAQTATHTPGDLTASQLAMLERLREVGPQRAIRCNARNLGDLLRLGFVTRARVPGWSSQVLYVIAPAGRAAIAKAGVRS